MAGAYEVEPEVPSIFPGLRERMRNLPPFLRDAKLDFKFRTYYWDRTRPDGTENRAWAGGGNLVAFKSGKWLDRLSVGASYYGSFAIDAPDDKSGTQLLGPDQEDLTVLGQAFVRLHFNDIEADLYRRTANLPYLNANDSRMIPNTFEAYGISRRGTGRDFDIAHFRKIKLRDSEEFIHMSEAAGVADSDKGLSTIGGEINLENLAFGGITQYTWDLFNTFYAEVDWTGSLSAEASFRLTGQLTDQRSVGDELLGDFSTHSWGLRGAVSRYGAIYSLTFTSTDDEAGIRNPFGGSASVNSLMLRSFARADEDALGLGLSMNFKRFGSGLSGFIRLIHGQDARDPATNMSLPDQTEFNITIDHRPETGPLKGLWLRARYAYLDIDGGDSDENWRLIVNYQLPTL